MPTKIVLVETSHPGNIGAAARAMKNMGLSELVLVRPKHFPHAEATARASGADDVLARAAVFDTLVDALADSVYTIASSARQRTISWPEFEPQEAAKRLVCESSTTAKTAVVFGPETSGLKNDDLELCQALVCIPSVAEFPSLNLAMAVQLISYEIRLASRDAKPAGPQRESPLATHEDLEKLFSHLETSLTESGFLNPQSPRKLMPRLRRLIARALPDQNEVNILRGILASLWSDRRS